ncbi:MAG: HAMP domain-containing sensor histidine kinase, partial [Cyanobacteria bacterium J06632_3]
AVTLRRVDEVLDSITASSAIRHAEYQLEQAEPMHRELLSSNQELIRTVQKQKDNASHLAHELKNPLNAIISFAALLLRKWRAEEPPREKEAEQIERILENGKRILALINNMLEISRKAFQTPTLNIESVDVAKLVGRIAESLEADATEKGLELSVDCELSPPLIHTDRLRLQQILVKLITNAIRYTDKGSIAIRCYGVGFDRWAIAVSDTGQGISADEQQGIFKPYVRAGSEASHQSDSSGLGLAIVSKLVELLQGEISLTSMPGKGSTFTVTMLLDIADSK